MGEKRAGIVSIIVPVYNAEQFIRQTINCVQAQTYTNWELLLVDDCSSDKSREYIQEKSSTDQRIKLVSLKKNSGAAEARNRGVKEACGQYICYLDADDIWLPEKLTVCRRRWNERRRCWSARICLLLTGMGGKTAKEYYESAEAAQICFRDRVGE